MSDLHIWSSHWVVSAHLTEEIIIHLRSGHNVSTWNIGREPWKQNLCDWCGEPFSIGEKRYRGYDGNHTHQKCRRESLKQWWRDNEDKRDDTPEERYFHPGDYPNGQGTFD